MRESSTEQHEPEVNRYHFDPAYVRVGYDPQHPVRVRMNSNTSHNITDLEIESSPYGYSVPAIGEPVMTFWAQPAYGAQGNSGMFTIPTSYLPLLLNKLSQIMPLADGGWQDAIDGLTVWETES